MEAITLTNLNAYEAAFDADPAARVAMNAVVNQGVNAVARAYDAARSVPHEFSILLEQGDITMHIDYTSYDVKGTQLNDRMTTFLNESNKIQSQLRELGQEEYEGYANNKDMNEVYSSINKKMAALDAEYEKLLTKFVEDNFDNVLGPWAFSLYAIRYQYPMLDDWIEFIMSKATDKFKNDPIIRDYYEAALKNQNIMNGTETPVNAASVAPAPGTTSDAPEAPKTPAELAGDTTKK